jgi:hypothetical protein
MHNNVNTNKILESNKKLHCTVTRVSVFRFVCTIFRTEICLDSLVPCNIGNQSLNSSLDVTDTVVMRKLGSVILSNVTVVSTTGEVFQRQESLASLEIPSHYHHHHHHHYLYTGLVTSSHIVSPAAFYGAEYCTCILEIPVTWSVA